ncbi:MAG: helix-turn-helix domain-containing protein [Oscillospiraceae bacterium]|nr:helix-turn-helix domain-containing protein [Oscillospiraceae bacterium]
MTLSQKYLLTIKEASEYFNIGINKMYRIAREDIDGEGFFTIQNSSRLMIKRERFEEYLNKSFSI